MLASAAGMIEKTSDETYFGKSIVVNHLNGFKTVYAHLDSIIPSKNTFVQKNEQIGTLGNSGYSTSPHLHYEIWQHEKKENPQNFIKDN